MIFSALIISCNS